jgi:thiol:disulfide interchange protein DsbD
MTRSMVMATLRVSSAVVLMVGIGQSLAAQESPVTWTLVPSASTVVAGGTVTATLTASISSGWHLYSLTQGPGGPIPTRISVAGGPIFVLADSIRAPAPESAMDPNFGIVVETYEGTTTFTIPVRVAQTAKAGHDTLAVTARYEACNASVCLPPRIATVTTPVTVTAAHAARKPAPTS